MFAAKNSRWTQIVVPALLLALAAQVALASYFTDPTKVNLMRKVDPATLAWLTTGQWVGLTNNGGVENPAWHAWDGGQDKTQLGFDGTSNATNAGRLQITLPEAVDAKTIVTLFGSHTADQFRILGSATGFGAGMSTLVDWRAPTVTSTLPAATSVKYLQFEFTGTTPVKYLQLQELQVFPDASAQIPVENSGYDLFFQRSAIAAGGVPNNSLYRSSNWQDDPNRAVDLDVIGGYLRANGLSADHTDPWFVIPMSDSFELSGASVGFYEGQSWSGMKIEYTNDATIDANTVWHQAFNQTTTVSTQMVPFASPVDARFLRVSTPWAGSTGALCELEVFAVPEPATMSLLALGGLALLKRRR